MKKLFAFILLLLFAATIHAATIGTRDGGTIDTGTLLEGAAVGMSATEGQTIASGCTAACNEANITFFWDCEDTTIQTDQDCVSGGDFTAGDTSAVAASSAAINSDAVKHGTNGCDFPTSGDHYQFSTDIANIIDGGNDGKVAFWFRVDASWTTGRNLFVARETGNGYGLTIMLSGTDELSVQWYDKILGTLLKLVLMKTMTRFMWRLMMFSC
jgi:hypothetical protein